MAGKLEFEGRLDDLDGNTIRKDPRGFGWEVSAFNSANHAAVDVMFSREFYDELRLLGLKSGVGQRLRVTVEVL